MTPEMVLETVVLRCGDLERSRAFYEAIGLRFVEEQHGNGARHYACTLGPVVLELYPLVGRSSAGLRLGLRRERVEDAIAAVSAMGAEIVRVRRDGPCVTAVIRDPDGHEIALTEPQGVSRG